MDILQLNQVGKSYRGKRVLQDVTVSLPVGLNLLTGPSGAGKSTLLRLLASAEVPDRGEIIWDGQPLPAARTSLRRSLGYAPQAVELPDDLSARSFAMHIAALKGLDLAAADEQFGAIAAAIGLQDDLDTRIGAYSGGMRRRLVFAQALLGAPRLLALDEPTAELDGETARKVGALIVERARSAVVVMTTHLADELTPQAVQILRVDSGNVVPA
jgi:ABC-2 type transport system ATP-binding protein